MSRVSFFVISIALTACVSLSSEPDPNLLEAIRWYTGEAGEIDDKRARELLLHSVEKEHPVSVMWLARVYSTGRMGFSADKPRAVQLAASVIHEIENAANSGVIEAMFLMGTAYAEGLGKPVDPALAVSWYRLAAEQGNTLAQHNMGNVYSAGVGVKQSDTLAVYWWELAAAQGDAIPQFRLGEMYEQGRGVEQDIEAALRWYEDSAQRGFANAAAALRRIQNH